MVVKVEVVLIVMFTQLFAVSYSLAKLVTINTIGSLAACDFDDAVFFSSVLTTLLSRVVLLVAAVAVLAVVLFLLALSS